MNWFKKKIKIPKDNAQEVTELESYTVKWECYRNKYDGLTPKYKTFIHEGEAKEFVKQLVESGVFLGVPVYAESYKN